MDKSSLRPRPCRMHFFLAMALSVLLLFMLAAPPGAQASREPRYECDVLVAGGGAGGVSAAISAARLGARVILLEETDWLGGQLTAQAVPPDELRARLHERLASIEQDAQPD